jgi:hypothetical protein
MEVAAINLARSLAWVEPIDLNPTASVFYPDFAKAIVARYKFQKFPQKFEDFDVTKGIIFAGGRFENTTIEQLSIYAFGIALDTRVSTEESKRVLEEAFAWAGKELKLSYKPSMLKRWQYLSQINFYSEAPLTAISPAIQTLAAAVGGNIAGITGENLRYELTTLVVDYDQLARKHPLGRFSIQRRDNTPFSENKYFSDAPLPTETHIRLLREFEAAILAKG